MSPELIGVIGIIVLFILMSTRMWIGLSMAAVGFFGIAVLRGGFAQALNVVGSSAFNTISNFTMTTIPMFLLMGLVISETSIGRGLYRAAYAWIGRFRGGLAAATTCASGLLGAICSSHMTGTIIMSKIALPEMRKYKYSDELACGSIAGAAPLSILIPPSMPFIMYGIITEQPIGKLFMAGVIPGVILLFVDLVMIAVYTRRNPLAGPAGDRIAMKEKLKTTLEVLPMVILFLLVLGGIYLGFFTATESGAIGAAGAIVIAMVKKEMSFKKLLQCLATTATMSSTILVLLAGTNIFVSFITMCRLPQYLVGLVAGLNAPFIVLVLAVILIYIVLGMFLPDMPLIVLTVPIIYPIITALGWNPIWFGCLVVFMQALGSVTPPVGMAVYLLSGLADVSVIKIFKGVLPFIVGMVIVIILVIAFPSLATWLPAMMA